MRDDVFPHLLKKRTSSSNQLVHNCANLFDLPLIIKLSVSPHFLNTGLCPLSYECQLLINNLDVASLLLEPAPKELAEAPSHSKWPLVIGLLFYIVVILKSEESIYSDKL